MRITDLQTIQFDPGSSLTNTERDIDLTILQVHTDEGVIGLGETMPHAGMESAAIHGPIADRVLGADPQNISAIRDDLMTNFNYYGYAGAEFRALSALDIALWDIKGKLAGEPIYQLLGGKARERIPTYNTCYDQEFEFIEEPVALAESLLDEGITAMKVWPFDQFASETRGQRISPEHLKRGLDPIRQVREAVGDAMDIAVECHGLWSLTPGKRILRALAEFEPLWVEDVIRKGDYESYGHLAEAAEVPLCISERLIGRYEFLAALRTGAVDIVMPDICWTGGISEGMAIASLAEAHHLPVAPHNSGGPVMHVANAHLNTAIPNLYIMETIRDRYNGWHRNLVTDPLPAENGTIAPPEKPGLGTSFEETLLDHEDTEVRQSSL